MEIRRLEYLGVAPTPWRCHDVYWVKDARESEVVDCYRHNENVAQTEADSRLIAAAPDLYEALRLVLETIDALGFKPVVESDPLALAVKCGEKALEKAGGIK